MEEKELVVSICKKSKFSIITDECTAVSVSQVLAVMVRYYDARMCKDTDALLHVVEVDDASGEGLYKYVKEMLQRKEIALQNIRGLCL